MPTILELAHLSNAVYFPEGDYQLPEGWQEYGSRSDQTWDKSLAFCGQAYKDNKDNTVVISYRGTDPLRLSNIISDALLAMRSTHRGEEYAIIYAAQVVQKLIEEHGIDNLPRIVITGHSLGGNLAQAVSACFQNDGNLPFLNANRFQRVGKYLFQSSVDVGLIKTIQSFFEANKDYLPRLPSVTFQAPGVASLYLSEGKSSKDYKGLHLFNEGDIVKSAGHVNIGIQSMLPITTRPEFKNLIAITGAETPSIADTESVLDSDMDTASEPPSRQSSIFNSSDDQRAGSITPPSSIASSDHLDTNMEEVSKKLSTQSNLSDQASSSSYAQPFTDLSTSLASTGTYVSDALSSTAQTVFNAYPAHLITQTIKVLETQPGIANLTPEQYMDVMTDRKQLDILTALTPTQYDLIPYHKSILLQAVSNNNLGSSEVSTIVEALKGVRALDEQETTLRKLGRNRLISWQKQSLMKKDETGSMDSWSFEMLTKVRKNINEHRRELREPCNRLQTWLANNRAELEKEHELVKSGSNVLSAIQLDALEAENTKLEMVLEKIYKEAILDANTVIKSLTELEESLNSDVDMDRETSLSNENDKIKVEQLNQIKAEKQSINFELQQLTSEYSALKSLSPKSIDQMEVESTESVELHSEDLEHEKIRVEQMDLLKEMAFSKTAWTPTAAMAIQPLLKEMAETREEIMETLNQANQKIELQLGDIDGFLSKVTHTPQLSPLSETDRQTVLNMMNSTTRAIIHSNIETTALSETIMSDLQTVKKGLETACKSIIDKKSSSWMSGTVLRHLSNEPGALELTLKILKEEQTKIENEIVMLQKKMDSFQIKGEAIKERHTKHVEVISSMHAQPTNERLAAMFGSETNNNIHPSATKSQTMSSVSPPPVPTQHAGKKRSHSEMEPDVSDYHRQKLDEKFGKDGWSHLSGNGLKVSGKPFVVEPEGCNKDTLQSACFITKEASVKRYRTAPARVTIVKAEDMSEEIKAEIAAKNSVEFTVNKRSRQRTRRGC